MKYRIVLTAAILSALICACCDDIRHARASMTIADSLLSADPDSSLAILQGMDSSVIERLGKRDMALYTLLLAEAEYKCWMPVDDDTIINESVHYYRHHGPEDMYARALTMQGAVYLERGEYILSLECYKKAEQIIMKGTDLLEQGLLHTRIAELYQFTYINKEATIDRYRMALDCFRKANLTDRVMFGNLSLARVMLFERPDEALAYIKGGSALAELLNDRDMILVGLELLTQYHDIKKDPDGVISTASEALRQYNTDDEWIRPIITNILVCLTKAYADKGDSVNARKTADLIYWKDEDRQVRHYIMSKLAASREDWKSALENERITEGIADSIMRAGLDLHLREVERNFENSRLREEYTALKSRYISYAVILLFLICMTVLAGLLIHLKNISLKREVEKSTDIIRNLSNGRMDNGNGTGAAESSTGRTGRSRPMNRESVAISEEMLKVTDELLDAYYKYGRTKAIAEHVKKILESHFPADDTMTRIMKIVNATYPGFLTGLRDAHPALKEKDLYLIAMMACGFSTGTICALRRITESSLYVEKSRIAKKIGDNVRLSEYVSRALETGEIS